MQPSNKLFRKVALDRLSSPEQIDRLARVTRPRAWIALIGLSALVITAIVWSVVATIPTSLPAQGILLRGDGIQLVRAPRNAQVARLLVSPGDTIKANQPVVSLMDMDNNQTFDVPSIQAGRVLEIRVNQGDILTFGQPILSTEPIAGDLEGVVFVSSAISKQLQPGNTVQIYPANVQRESYGFMVGKIKSVSAFPATQQGMLRVLGSDELVKQFSQINSPAEVRIELEKGDTSSGFQWSSPQGPSFPITTGTFCEVSIIIGEQHPISMILGIPNR